MFDLTQYDSFEVHPCRVAGVGEVMVQEGTRPYEMMEQVDENDPEIAVWCVYGHVRDDLQSPNQGKLEWLADCPTGDIAYLVRDLFREWFMYHSQNPASLQETAEEVEEAMRLHAEDEMTPDELAKALLNRWTIADTLGAEGNIELDYASQKEVAEFIAEQIAAHGDLCDPYSAERAEAKNREQEQ